MNTFLSKSAVLNLISSAIHCDTRLHLPDTLSEIELTARWNLPKTTVAKLANYFLLNYNGKYFKRRVTKHTDYVIAVEDEVYKCIFLDTTYAECIKSDKVYLSFRNPLDCYKQEPVVLVRNSKKHPD